jgi:sigma-B regulation protein RsbU (phosphoserine phosphatase)
LTQHPQIAVITANRRTRRHVTRSLALSGWELHFSDFEPGRLAVQIEAPRDLYIVDAASERPEIRTFVERLSATNPAALTRVVLLTQRLDRPDLAELFCARGVDHYVGRHAALPPNQELIDETELIVTAKKICDGELFGLDKYLARWGVRLQTSEIASTDEKANAVGQLENYLNRIDCPSSILPAVSLVAEELLMNAIFSAPRLPEGQARYAARERADPVSLESHEHCSFSFGCDGRHLGIAVADRFGSLTRADIVRYLGPTFAGAPAHMEQKQGGAGLGLYMTFNSVTQMVFNIAPGHSTEVIALFYIRSGARAFRGSARSLHVFGV